MLSRLALILVLASALQAQTPSGGVGSGTVTWMAMEPTPTAYLVEYTTTEKCYECSLRLAIGCIPERPDCGVPDKEVAHFEEFTTLENAVKFINAGMVNDSNSANARFGLAIDWARVSGSPARPEARTFKRLLAVRPVPLDKQVTVIEEPQPAKRTEQVRYSVAGEAEKTKK